MTLRGTIGGALSEAFAASAARILAPARDRLGRPQPHSPRDVVTMAAAYCALWAWHKTTGWTPEDA